MPPSPLQASTHPPLSFATASQRGSSLPPTPAAAPSTQVCEQHPPASPRPFETGAWFSTPEGRRRTVLVGREPTAPAAGPAGEAGAGPVVALLYYHL